MATFLGCVSRLIHDNMELTDADKFACLWQLLLCTALDAIMELYLSEENYVTVVRCLQERFDDPRWIISTRMDALLNLASVNNEHDILCPKECKCIVQLTIMFEN